MDAKNAASVPRSTPKKLAMLSETPGYKTKKVTRAHNKVHNKKRRRETTFDFKSANSLNTVTTATISVIMER